jgi:serine protease Do
VASSDALGAIRPISPQRESRNSMGRDFRQASTPALLFTILSLYAVPCLAQPVSGRGQSVAQALSQEFAQVARLVTPTVVNISTTAIVQGTRSPFSSMFGRFCGGDLGDVFGQTPEEVTSLGSGVLFRADGYIITNNHVIANGTQIAVKLSTEIEYQGTVVGTDALSDLAVVHIPATGLPATKWGDSDALQVGEWVIAIGTPRGLAQTVTAGIISAKGRHDIGLSGYEDFIQTDAAINPGNSGGALVNMGAELVGINTAIASQSGGYEGIGFAIPSNVAQRIAQQLITKHRVVRGWVGIFPRALSAADMRTANPGNPSGVLIARMYRSQPAHRAGLLPNDTILAWGGLPVKSVNELSRMVAEAQIGGKVQVLFNRGGKQYTMPVEVGERPQEVQGRAVPGI